MYKRFLLLLFLASPIIPPGQDLALLMDDTGCVVVLEGTAEYLRKADMIIRIWVVEKVQNQDEIVF